jgi:hypothetical protein
LSDQASLLGTVYAANAGEGIWLGVRQTITVAGAAGWQWIDGTSATAINCGALGCGVWAAGEPRYVVKAMWWLPVHPVDGLLRKPPG